MVESKDELRKRLGRSPDAGDSLAISCWVDIDDPADTDEPDPDPVPYEAAVQAGYGPDAGLSYGGDLDLDSGLYDDADDYL